MAPMMTLLFTGELMLLKFKKGLTEMFVLFVKKRKILKFRIKRHNCEFSAKVL